jgi:putative RNA 2'-phosphotransferase
VVLRVDAAAMAEDGARFACSPNGVWLVDVVPPRYLRLVDEGTPADG